MPAGAVLVDVWGLAHRWPVGTPSTGQAPREPWPTKWRLRAAVAVDVGLKLCGSGPFLAGVRWAPTSSSPRVRAREQGLNRCWAWTGAESQPRADLCPCSQPAAGAEWLWGRDPGLCAAPGLPLLPGARPKEWLCLADSSACESRRNQAPRDGRRSHSCPLDAGR